MELSLTTTVTFLSAGQSSYLQQSIHEVVAGSLRPTCVEVAWSGDERSVPQFPPEVHAILVAPGTFDHGATRQAVLERCRTEIQVFLTDDAVPVRPDWLESICRPFRDPRVAAVYGRQIARPDAPLFERVFRRTKYPDESAELREADRRRIAAGIAPVSDANAAYRAETLRSLGGFPRPSLFAEDVAVALQAVDSGWTVSYANSAAVWHSHSLSWPQMFDRAWRSALAGATFPRPRTAGWAIAPAAGMVGRMLKHGWREGGSAGVLEVLGGVGARTAGYGLGSVVAKLTRPLRRRTSLVPSPDGPRSPAMPTSQSG